MRQVGSLETEQQAARLADYLLVQGIESRIDRGEEGWVLWALDDDLVSQAKDELQAFQKTPDDPRYDAAAGEARQIRKEQQEFEERARKNTIRVRPGSNFMMGPRPITLGLIGISVVVAVLTRLGDQLDPFGLMLVINTRYLPNGPPLFTDFYAGQIWRIVTPIFLHKGPLHLLFNTVMIYQFGSMFEQVKGSARMVAFVLVTAVVSNLAQYWWTSLPIFGGLSGVLYALFGYMWMKTRYDPSAGFMLPQSTVVILIAWMFLCMTGFLGNIGNAAHVAGLISGMAIGYAPIFWMQGRWR